MQVMSLDTTEGRRLLPADGVGTAVPKETAAGKDWGGHPKREQLENQKKGGF